MVGTVWGKNHQVPVSRLYAPSGLWPQLTGIPMEHHTAHGLQFNFENYLLLEHEKCELIKTPKRTAANT